VGRNRTHITVRKEEVDLGGVANLHALWDWEGMAPCMGSLNLVRAHSIWAGLCPGKLQLLYWTVLKLYNLGGPVWVKFQQVTRP